MKRITDRDFKYVSSVETNIAKTFAKVRRQLRAERDARDAMPDRDAKILRMRALERRA